MGIVTLAEVLRRIFVAPILLVSFCTACSYLTQKPVEGPIPCLSNSECVVAIRIDRCCACPEIVSSSQLNHDRGLRIYKIGQNTDHQVPASCATVNCLICPLAPVGVTCRAGKCQAAQTEQEVLAACPTCYAQAAQAAYKDGNFEHAVGDCQKIGASEQTNCFRMLFGAALAGGVLNQAEQVCRNNLSQNPSDCLPALSLKWADQDANHALVLCDDLSLTDAQYIHCVQDVIEIVKDKQGKDKALELCSRLAGEAAAACRDKVIP